jgi:hypothetical protein
VVPALRKEREGRGTHIAGDANEIRSLGHPPNPLPVLVGKSLFAYTLSARRSSSPALLLLGFYNWFFGNSKESLRAFFKVLQRLRHFPTIQVVS